MPTGSQVQISPRQKNKLTEIQHSEWVLLAEEIDSGRLGAEELEDHAGLRLRHLRSPARATLGQLRDEVHGLRFGFANAVARGELADADLAGQVESALEQVDRALVFSRPPGSAVVPHLKRASELLLRYAKVSTISPSPARLAPIAATAWAASVRLFKV